MTPLSKEEVLFKISPNYRKWIDKNNGSLYNVQVNGHEVFAAMEKYAEQFKPTQQAERMFTLDEMKDAHTAGVVAGNKHATCQPLLTQEEYFKEKFNINL